MAVTFRFDKDNGLDVSWRNEGATDLTAEEAAVIAQMDIKDAILKLTEEVSKRNRTE